MTEIRAALVDAMPAANHTIIPKGIAACLPASILRDLAHMPEASQIAFLKDFEKQSRSLALAYLSSLFYCHYGLLGRWAMTGIMWTSLFVTASLGSIWWLIDLVRMPAMVRAHNQHVAVEIMRRLSVARDPTP